MDWIGQMDLQKTMSSYWRRKLPNGLNNWFTVILMEYLFFCLYARQAFHFFLDKKTKQKNQGLQ